MSAIWKFVLSPSLPVSIPAGARVLSAGAEGDDLVVWAAIDPYATRVRRDIAVVPTGSPAPGGGTFVDTVQRDDGLVFHIFDRGEQ